MFFSGRHESVIGHVAVYEGNGMVIQAEQSGYRIMRSRLTDVIAFSGRYRGATRPLSHGRQAAGPHLSSVTSQVAGHRRVGDRSPAAGSATRPR